MMFLDGYSERLLSGVEDDDTVARSFHSMAVGFLDWKSLAFRDLRR